MRKEATPEQIKSAWRRACRKYHPDRNGGDVNMMTLCNRAYEVLSDPEKRSFYDAHGTEPRLTTREQATRMILIQAAVQGAAGAPKHNNLVHSITAVIEHLHSEAAKKISGTLESIDKLSYHVGKIECKDGENFIKRALEDQVAQMNAAVESLTEHQAALEDARKLLKKFSYAVKNQGSDFFSQYNSVFLSR